MTVSNFSIMLIIIVLIAFVCLIIAILLIHKMIRKEREKTEKMIMRILIVLLLLFCLPAVADDRPPFQPGGGPAPISLPELSRAGDVLQGYIFGSSEDEATWRAGALCFLNITNLTTNSSENMTA